MKEAPTSMFARYISNCFLNTGTDRTLVASQKMKLCFPRALIPEAVVDAAGESSALIVESGSLANVKCSLSSWNWKYRNSVHFKPFLSMALFLPCSTNDPSLVSECTGISCSHLNGGLGRFHQRLKAFATLNHLPTAFEADLEEHTNPARGTAPQISVRRRETNGAATLRLKLFYTERCRQAYLRLLQQLHSRFCNHAVS